MSLMKQSQAAPPEPPEPNTVPITVGSQATFLPTYGQYPLWLDSSGLSPTARIVYFAIYFRAITQSWQNHTKYSNDQGQIFVVYTNKALATNCQISLSCVKSAKSTLIQKGYISIEPINGSNAVRIYPRFPKSAKTYCGKISPKSNTKANSSFDEDDFFEASIKKNLPPDAYEAYCNMHRT